MLLRGLSFPNALSPRKQISVPASRGCFHLRLGTLSSSTHRASCHGKVLCLNLAPTDVVSDILHNKVLLSAALCTAIGQLLKPFTSTLFYGNEFDLRAAFQAGGFPSTHSSTVVATATSLGLERGFSDAIFGLAVVYAGLVMYDAQGVRREVGTHAKVLNKVLRKPRLNSPPSREDDANDCSILLAESNSGVSMQESPGNAAPELSIKGNEISSPAATSNSIATSSDVNRGLEGVGLRGTPLKLKESIGHTEAEVIAGALFGFFVGLAVCAT